MVNVGTAEEGRRWVLHEAFVWLDGGFNLSVTQLKASPPAPAPPNHNRRSRSEVGSELHFKQVTTFPPRLSSTMPTLAAITADNKKWKSTFRPVIVAAGGTGGPPPHPLRSS